MDARQASQPSEFIIPILYTQHAPVYTQHAPRRRERAATGLHLRMVATSTDCRRRVMHILHRAPPEGAEDSSGDAALPQQPAICVSTGGAIAAVPLARPVCAGGPSHERGIAGLYFLAPTWRKSKMHSWVRAMQLDARGTSSFRAPH